MSHGAASLSEMNQQILGMAAVITNIASQMPNRTLKPGTPLQGQKGEQLCCMACHAAQYAVQASKYSYDVRCKIFERLQTLLNS